MRRAFLVVICLWPLVARGADFTVNWTDAQQTIDGFGCSDAWLGSNGGWPNGNTTIDLLFSPTSGIGLNLFRAGFDGNGNPLGNFTTAAQVAARHPTTYFWAAPWGGTGTAQGQSMSPANYSTWANTMRTYANNFRTQTGQYLSAMSLENEPDYNGNGSIHWDPSPAVTFVRDYMGPALATAGASGGRIPITVPDSSLWTTLTGTNMFLDTFEATPLAKQYLGWYSVHQYNTNASYNTAVPAGTNFSARTNLHLWQTEASDAAYSSMTGFDAGLPSALTTARWIHDAITIGGVNAWHYWWCVGLNGDNEGLIGYSGNKGQLTKRVYSMGNFSKFIRPGWVRIGTTGSKSGLYGVTAYKNAATNDFAIVAINDSGSPVSTSFALSGVTATSVAPYVTTDTSVSTIGTDGNLSLGSATKGIGSSIAVLSGVFTATIPPGVTTFVGAGGASTGTNPPYGQRFAVMMSPTAGETFVGSTINLRLLATAKSGGNCDAASSVTFYIDGAPVTLSGASNDGCVFKGWYSYTPAAHGDHTVYVHATFADAPTQLDSLPITFTTQAAPTYAGGVITLAGNRDISTLLTLAGTADSRIKVDGAGYAITGTTTSAVSWNYVDFYNVGNPASTSTPGIDVTTSNNLSIQNCRFDYSNPTKWTTNGSGTVTVRGNLWRSTMRTPVGQSQEPPDTYGTVWLAGDSTAAGKVFAGNNVALGWVYFDAQQNWMIGGDADADSNIIIGPRGGVFFQWARGWNGSASNMVIKRNYLKEHNYGGWSQPSTIELANSTTTTVEHNIIAGGGWNEGLAGEVRYNLWINPTAEGQIWPESNAFIHHNVILGSAGAKATIFFNGASGVRFLNNTLDGLDGAGGSVYLSMIQIPSGTQTIDSNILSRESFIGGEYPVKITGGTVSTSYNQFYGVGATHYSDRSNNQTGDSSADPSFANPATYVYEYDEVAIWKRTLSVATVLSQYRARYTPSNAAAGSTATFGTGNTTGAINATTATGLQFGNLNSGRSDTGFGFTISTSHPRLWWTPTRLAQAQAYLAANPFTPGGGDYYGIAWKHAVAGTSCAAAISWALAFTLPCADGVFGDACRDPARTEGWKVSAIYDWCFDEMNDAQRTQLLTNIAGSGHGWNDYIAAIIGRPVVSAIDYWGNPGMTQSNYNWGYFGNDLNFGIATFTESPTSAASFLADGLTARWTNNFVPSTTTYNRGGVPDEGVAYGSAMTPPYSIGLTLRDGGRDLLNETDFHKQYIYWLIYGTTPAATYSSTSGLTVHQVSPYADDEHFSEGGTLAIRTYYQDTMVNASTVWKSIPLGGYARQWVNNLGALSGATYYTLSQDVSPATATPYTSLALDLYASGIQYLYGRKAWDTSSTFFHWQLGAGRAPGSSDGHVHVDVGNFHIWRGGRWLTRETTGYGNTITGYAGSTTDNCGSNLYSGGCTSGALAHNLVVWDVPLGSWGPTLPAPGNTTGNAAVQRLESTAGYTYADVDLTPRYLYGSANDQGVVVHVERELLFLRDLETTVVFDRLATGTPTSGADLGKTPAQIVTTFLLHAETNPTLEDTTHLTITNGTQALRVTTLVPSNPTRRVITEGGAIGQYRIELDTSGAAQRYFLHVLQARDAGAANLTASVVDSNPANPISGTFTVTLHPSAGSDTIVVFNKGTTSSGGTISLAGAGATALRSDVQTVAYTDAGPVWGGAGPPVLIPTLSAATLVGHSIPSFALVGSTVAISSIPAGDVIYYCVSSSACTPVRTTSTRYTSPLSPTSGQTICAAAWKGQKRHSTSCTTYTVQ